MQKPSPSTYIPAAKRYVDLVPEGDLITLLTENSAAVVSFFSAIPADKHDFSYLPGKWTVKQMLLHIADAERVFAYRAMTLARGDRSAVFPNMDEALFAANADPSERTLADILQEFQTVREASLCLFRNLTSQQLQSEGKLFGHPVTPEGFAYIIIGHPLHHLNILKERYLTGSI